MSVANTSASPSPSPSLRRRVIGDYVIQRRIGSGSFATVYQCASLTDGRVVAIKSVNKDKLIGSAKFASNLSLEIDIIRQLNNRHIVSFIDCIESKRHVSIVLEYCAGGDLSRFIRRKSPLSIAQIKRLMGQFADGLIFLRRRNLIHRDLKPQNLLLQSDTDSSGVGGSDAFILKIADFGFARYIGADAVAATLCGSPLYMAPEILRHQSYDYRADLWSVGTILYEMCYGKPPFTATDPTALIHAIARANDNIVFPTAPSTAHITDECKHLIRSLLKLDPNKRITFDEFIQHNFIREETMSMRMHDDITIPQTITLKPIDETSATNIRPQQPQTSAVAVSTHVQQQVDFEQPQPLAQQQQPPSIHSVQDPLTSAETTNPTSGGVVAAADGVGVGGGSVDDVESGYDMMDDVYNHRRSVISIPDNTEPSRSLLAELTSDADLCCRIGAEYTQRATAAYSMAEARSHCLVASRCYMRAAEIALLTIAQITDEQAIAVLDQIILFALEAADGLINNAQRRSADGRSSPMRQRIVIGTEPSQSKPLHREGDSPSPIPSPSILLSSSSCCPHCGAIDVFLDLCKAAIGAECTSLTDSSLRTYTDAGAIAAMIVRGIDGIQFDDADDDDDSQQSSGRGSRQRTAMEFVADLQSVQQFIALQTQEQPIVAGAAAVV